ncbi:fimbrial adhesin StfH, partial [Salmonella enterica subsp. enterica serovar Infantis]
MRSIRILFLLLVAVYCSSVVAKPMLKATFPSTTMYYGIGPNSDKSIVVEVTIATPEGVYYGSWNLGGHRKGDTLPANSWSGPEPAPKVVLKDFDNTVSRSACKNLPSNWRGCGSFTL